MWWDLNIIYPEFPLYMGNISSQYAHLTMEYLSLTYQSHLFLFIALITPIFPFLVKYMIPLLSAGSMFASFHIEDVFVLSSVMLLYLYLCFLSLCVYFVLTGLTAGLDIMEEALVKFLQIMPASPAGLFLRIPSFRHDPRIFRRPRIYIPVLGSAMVRHK